MAYLDIPFPECIAFGAMTGVEWDVAVSRNQAGFEQRSGTWVYALQDYDVGFAVRTATDYQAIKVHWNSVRGRLHKFPFKDPLDHSTTVAESRLYAVAGSPATFQLFKLYGTGAGEYLRKITRPLGPVIYRNGTPATAGAAAGQYSLNSSTGRVTFVPDQSRAVISHTAGATHQFTLATAFSPNVTVGAIVYLSGVTGSAATRLNNVQLEVSAVAGAVISVNVNSTGLTASGGTSTRQVEAAELTWSGEFVVPCRYDIDKLPGAIINRVGGSGELLVQCDQIRVCEVRE